MIFPLIQKRENVSQVLVAHGCNPSYSGGRDQEDHVLKPAQANSLWDLSQKKNPSQKRAGGVAQGVGSEFKPQYWKKKKKRKMSLVIYIIFVFLRLKLKSVLSIRHTFSHGQHEQVPWPDWEWLGIEKKDTKTDIEKSWGRVHPILLMRDAGDILCFEAHLFIQHIWKSGVKCRLSSHGFTCVGCRNSTAVVCCYLVQTILTRSAGPVFLVRQPCWTLPPLTRSVPISQEALWQSHARVKATCTASVSPLARQPCWTLLTLGLCLLSTKGLDMTMLMSKFLLSLFSYWSPTLLNTF
jgi:hypothetical protein